MTGEKQEEHGGRNDEDRYRALKKQVLLTCPIFCSFLVFAGGWAEAVRLPQAVSEIVGAILKGLVWPFRYVVRCGAGPGWWDYAVAVIVRLAVHL